MVLINHVEWTKPCGALCKGDMHCVRHVTELINETNAMTNHAIKNGFFIG